MVATSNGETDARLASRLPSRTGLLLGAPSPLLAQVIDPAKPTITR